MKPAIPPNIKTTAEEINNKPNAAKNYILSNAMEATLLRVPPAKQA